MNEYDQDRINNAVEVLRRGAVDVYLCCNDFGFIYPSDFPMLINLGVAEEVHYDGRTWLVLKEGKQEE